MFISYISKGIFFLKYETFTTTLNGHGIESVLVRRKPELPQNLEPEVIVTKFPWPYRHEILKGFCAGLPICIQNVAVDIDNFDISNTNCFYLYSTSTLSKEMILKTRKILTIIYPCWYFKWFTKVSFDNFETI